MKPNYADLLSAVVFAAHKHRAQRRKDAEASPYINHPIALAHMLAAEGGVNDLKTLIAAILHDTVEDTETTYAELVDHFGRKVAPNANCWLGARPSLNAESLAMLVQLEPSSL